MGQLFIFTRFQSCISGTRDWDVDLLLMWFVITWAGPVHHSSGAEVSLITDSSQTRINPPGQPCLMNNIQYDYVKSCKRLNGTRPRGHYWIAELCSATPWITNVTRDFLKWQEWTEYQVISMLDMVLLCIPSHFGSVKFCWELFDMGWLGIV